MLQVRIAMLAKYKFGKDKEDEMDGDEEEEIYPPSKFGWEC